MTAPVLSRRGTVLGGFALAAAALLFGSGVLVANALRDDGDGPAATPVDGAPDIARPLPGVAIGSPPLTGPASSGSSKDGGSATPPQRGGGGELLSSQYHPGCQAPAGDILNGAIVDASKAGFVLRLPGPGFTLLSLNFRGEGECNDQGQAITGTLTVDGTWRHDETGAIVNLTQRAAREAAANVIAGESAVWWADGYGFFASAYAFHIAEKPLPPQQGPDRPSVAPGEPNPADPANARKALEALIAQVSPSVDGQCFYRQREGSWADLAALGIGDPRPAIPSGFTEQSITVRAFDTPPASCNAPALTGFAGFDASFVQTSGGEFRGAIFISAYAADPSQGQYPGNFNDYGANWNNGKFQFSIGAKSEQGIGKEAIRKIALALDPSFAQACLIEDQQLKPSDLAGLGFREPRAPEGYRIAQSTLTRQALSATCKDTPETRQTASINLQWQMLSSDNTAGIFATASRHAGIQGQPRGGSISNFGLNWVDANGNVYSVYAKSANGKDPSRDKLVAVAKSLDPTLDPSTLREEDGGGGIEPLPAPAPAKP